MQTAKMFGDFLVEKGLVDQGTVLDLLIEQVKQAPSVAEVVHRHSLLPKEMQLNILRVQTMNGWDYQQASVHLGVWSNEIAARVATETTKSRTPIGQMLVQRSKIKFSDLTKALDEFLEVVSSVEQNQEKVPGTPVVPTLVKVVNETSPKSKDPQEKKTVAESSVVEPSPTPSKISSSSRTEFVLNFQKIDDLLLSEYLEMLPDDKKNELEVEIMSWEEKFRSNGRDAVLAGIRSVYRDFHSIKGAARFVRAELTERIVHELEDILMMCIESPGAIDAMGINQVMDFGVRTLDLIWRIKGFLVSEKSEKGYWHTQAESSSFLELYDSMRERKEPVAA